VPRSGGGGCGSRTGFCTTGGGAGGGDGAATVKGAVRRRGDGRHPALPGRRTTSGDKAVLFDIIGHGSSVEVLSADGNWQLGKLVELVRGVAFEDGDWAVDVRLADPDVRYVFAGLGAGRGGKRGRVQDAGEGEGKQAKSSLGADGNGTGGSGG
jgi:hypothetical protein